MSVAVQKQDTNQIILALTLQPNELGQMVASIQTPTGVAIAPGVEFKLENAAARKFAFDFCEPSRCSASLIAGQELHTRGVCGGESNNRHSIFRLKAGKFRFPDQGI
jgi:invasion protein IalB